MLIAGPLADYLLEPAMREGGALTGVFGWLVGTGPGAGMGLIFVFAGLAAAVVGLGGYAFPIVRDAELLLPDHQADAGSASQLHGRLQELLEKRQNLIGAPHSEERELALKQISREMREIGRQRSVV
jgi:hypothetical protein